MQRSSARRRRRRLAGLLCVGGSVCAVASAAIGPVAPVAPGDVAPAAPASAAEFDTGILSRRGLNPQIADYFRDAPRFSPGRATVTVFANDIRRGRVQVLFDAEGQPCFDRALLDGAGLVVPAAASASPGDGAAAADSWCDDFRHAFPQTTVVLRPGQEEVRLIVPTAALRPAESDFSGFSRGGAAALLNYDLMAMRNESGENRSDFAALNTELGANLQDWIVRSRAYTSLQNGQVQTRPLNAYAQRTWLDRGATLQAGQINVANSMLSGDALTGVQVFPDAALATDDRRNVVMAEGVARTQARIEVRQVGALIYTTVVPPGPFTLAGLPLINGSSDLEVTVIEADGARNRFTVPAASIHAGSLGQRSGYSFALGRSRNLANGIGGGGGGADGDPAHERWLATASGTWPVGRQSSAGAAALLASGYQALGWGGDTQVLGGLKLKLQQRLSQAVVRDQSRRGSQFDISGYAAALPGNISLGFSSSLQSRGYRTLVDVTQDAAAALDPGARFRSQHTASFGWTHPVAGGFNASYSLATLQDERRARRLNLSWNKAFDFGTVSASVLRDLGGRPAGTFDAGSGNTFYVSLNIPLGRRSMRSYTSNSGGATRVGTAYSERLNDTLNYSLGAERDSGDHSNSFTAQLSALPRYAQVNFGASAHGTDSRSYYGGASGGLVLHADGLTASPYPVQDTFGILSAGGTPAVKIGTPQGPVWTDAWGRAVMPQLTPYGSSRIEVDTRSLPRNVDVRNGFRMVAAGRGSVNRVDFDLQRVRRLLLNARGADGAALPAGSYVLDGGGQFVGVVQDEGQILINNGAADAGTLTVSLPGEKPCQLRYTLPATPADDSIFETVDAVCHPT